MRVEEFHYRLNWRASGTFPGLHRSSQIGEGVEFHGHAPLLDSPDPRRLDLRASARDPMEQLLVKISRQRTAVPVYALADLSASMGFAGHARKLDVLAEFTASLGYSAYRSGDSFGFVGCDSAIRNDFYQPLSRAKAAGADIGQRLLATAPAGAGSVGLLDAARLIDGRRALVFLLSDFHFPDALLKRILRALARHQVVPVVFIDSMEYDQLPVFGLARVLDAETGRQRTLLLRPSFRRRLRSLFLDRFDNLNRTFAAHGTQALWIRDGFSPDEVTRYFHG